MLAAPVDVGRVRKRRQEAQKLMESKLVPDVEERLFLS